MSLRPLLKSGDDDDVDIVVPSQWPCAQVVVEDQREILLEGVSFALGIHIKHGGFGRNKYSNFWREIQKKPQQSRNQYLVRWRGRP